MRWRRGVLVMLVGAMALGLGGCYVPHFLVWLFGERHPKETIKAEYPLEAERLVIVVYAGTDVLFSDPTAPVEISGNMVNEIARNLAPRIKTIVHPVEVVRWQESNLEWPNMSLVDIAKAFQADVILYVELEQYTMIEERSASLLRGHVKARIQVARPAVEQNPVYETHVETLYPEDRPAGVLETTERTIRIITNRVFAQSVVNKFHDHEVEVRGGGP